MRKTAFFISVVLLLILLALIIPYAFNVVGIILFPKRTSVLSQLSLYQWFGVGILIFAVLRPMLKRNISWLETFTHELTHIIIALLFLRKIHLFHAEDGQGVVYTSGNNDYGLPPMALAPYCLPIYTYLLLSIRCLLEFHGLWIYDIIIGMTVCFHFYCFKNQTSSYQPDINQYPLIFSYTYIITAHIINFCIIWVAFFPQYNIYTSLWRLLTSIWNNGVYAICWLF